MVICMFQWTSMNLLFGEDRFADIDFSAEVQWNNYCYNAVIACTKENLGNEELPFCHENWFECIWMWQWELYINVFVHHCFITVLPDAWEAVLGTQVDIALHFVDFWEYTCATYSRALLDSLQFVVAINKPCGWTTQLPKLTNHFFRQCFQRVLVVAHVLSVFLISFHTHAIWAYEVSQYTYISNIGITYFLLSTYSQDLDIAGLLSKPIYSPDGLLSPYQKHGYWKRLCWGGILCSCCFTRCCAQVLYRNLGKRDQKWRVQTEMKRMTPMRICSNEKQLVELLENWSKGVLPYGIWWYVYIYRMCALPSKTLWIWTRVWLWTVDV